MRQGPEKISHNCYPPPDSAYLTAFPGHNLRFFLRERKDFQEKIFWGGVGAISLRVVFDILDGLICCDSSWDRVFCWLSAAGYTATGIIGIVGGGSSGIPWVIIGGIAFLGRGMGKGIDCTRRTACCKLC